MKLLAVFSTLANAQEYTHYEAGPNDMPVLRGSVIIKGGAGVADSKNIQTPRGVMTRVTDAEIKILRNNAVFQLHERNGYVMIDEATTDVENAAAVMEGRDISAPLVPEDYTAAGQLPPSVAATKADESQAAPLLPVSGPGTANRGTRKAAK